MRTVDCDARRRHNGDMSIARKLDRDTVNAIRCNAGGPDKQFIVHLCDVWLSGQAADGTSVEYAAEQLGELAANAKLTRNWMLSTARFSQMTRLSDRAEPGRWQCRVISMSADDEKSATVTITVDGTTGGVVSLIWEKPTSRWELAGDDPESWASRGILQLSTAQIGVCAQVAVEFANWR